MCNAWNHPPGCACGFSGHGFPRPNFIGHQQRTGGNKGTFSRPSYDWVYFGPITFKTECWWCGMPVFFHRNDNGGCVLFDRLGPPWPVHPCWQQNKHEQSTATKVFIERRIAQLQSFDARKFNLLEYGLANERQIEGYILGYDSKRRILPDPKRLNDPGTFLRLVVIQKTNGQHVGVLAPEKAVKDIVMCSYGTVNAECHKRRRTRDILCFRSVETKNISSTNTQRLYVSYDYLRIINLPWTHQTD